MLNEGDICVYMSECACVHMHMQHTHMQVPVQFCPDTCAGLSLLHSQSMFIQRWEQSLFHVLPGMVENSLVAAVQGYATLMGSSKASGMEDEAQTSSEELISENP